MPFSVPFQLCTKKFKTGVSLKKHFGLKHQERTPGIVQFLDESNSPCEQPKAAALTDEEMEDYLKWLGVLVERINGSLVPDHPGKSSNPQCVLYFSVLGLTHLLTPNFFHRKENGAMLTTFKCHRSTSLICFIVWETLWWTAYAMLPTSVNRFSRE